MGIGKVLGYMTLIGGIAAGGYFGGKALFEDEKEAKPAAPAARSVTVRSSPGAAPPAEYKVQNENLYKIADVESNPTLTALLGKEFKDASVEFALSNVKGDRLNATFWLNESEWKAFKEAVDSDTDGIVTKEEAKKFYENFKMRYYPSTDEPKDGNYSFSSFGLVKVK